MVINKQHKFVFIQVYKTGGESISSALGGITRPYGKHDRFDQLPDWCKSYFSFGFVRNPWDRAISSYSYLSKRGDKKATGSFEQYLNEVDPFTLKQHNVVRGCMYIGRFERLQEDFDIICTKINIPQRHLQHRNASHHKPYQQVYTKTSKDIISEKCAEDIEHFGFSFGSTATKNIGMVQ